MVSLEGTSYDVGGSSGAGGFVYSSHSIEDTTHKPYEWTPFLSDGVTVKPWSATAPWPAAGRSVVFTYVPHSTVAAAHQGVTVKIRYEIYDGIAALMKKVIVENSTATAVELRDLTLDRLRIKNAVLGRLLIDTDYHGRQGVYRRNDYDRTYGHVDTAEYREFTILYKDGPSYHVGNRPVRSGQRWETTFESFRSFLLLHSTDHYEAQRMEFKKMYRAVAPQLQEDLLFFHVLSDDPAFIRRRAAEAAELLEADPADVSEGRPVPRDDSRDESGERRVTRPLSGNWRSLRPALWPSNWPGRSNLHGRRSRRRAGWWVRKQRTGKAAVARAIGSCPSRLGLTPSPLGPGPAGDGLETQEQCRFGLRSRLMWAQWIP